MSEQDKALLALRKAKLKLMNHPNTLFLTNILFSLKIEFTDRVPTLGTEGVHLYVNAEWWNKWSNKQQVGLLAHEAWHVAFMHMFRRGTRDPKTWNYAGDYVINNMVLAAGMELPPGLHDSKYNGMTTEEVYDKLMQSPNPPNQPNEIGQDVMDPQAQDGDGEGEDGEGDGPSRKKPTQSELREMEEKVKDIVIKAATAAKMQGEKVAGSGSPEMERLIEELENPRIPWNVILLNFMSQFCRDDYTYRRFNKRFLPDFYMPSLYSESLPTINVYIDASGSVSDSDFAVFLSEVQSIKDMLNPKQMNVWSFDTELRSKTTLLEHDHVRDIHMRGYGGTAIGGVIEDIEDTKPEISIIFTDGYFSNVDYSKAAAASSVFFLIYDNERWDCPDSGIKTIHFDKD